MAAIMPFSEVLDLVDALPEGHSFDQTDAGLDSEVLDLVDAVPEGHSFEQTDAGLDFNDPDNMQVDHADPALDLISAQFTFNDQSLLVSDQTDPGRDPSSAPFMFEDPFVQDNTDLIDATDWAQDFDFNGSGYTFRSAVRDERPLGYVLAVDEDDTGDYDPALENRRNRKPTTRKRQALFQYEDTEMADGDEEQQHSDQEQPLNEPMPVVLRFAETGSRPRFTSQIEAWTAAAKVRSLEAEVGYSFRPRTTAAVQDEEADVAAQDHNGHPAARGCVLCRELEHDCSLLDNEFEWPCQSCSWEGEQCVLIMPPAKRLACASCTAARKKDKWLICSHLYDEANGEPCLRCAAKNEHCYAQPDMSSVYRRTYIDGDGQPRQNERPEQPIVRYPASCQQCQAAGNDCSLDNDASDRNCVSCRNRGLECVHIQLPCAPRQKRHAVITRQRPTAQPQATHEARKSAMNEQMVKTSRETRDSALQVQPAQQQMHRAPPGQQQTQPAHWNPAPPQQILSIRAIPHARLVQHKLESIKTKFCHPMVFNYDDFDGNDECHFCKTPILPIIGFEERRVAVKKLPKGRGWEEVRGGHAADGVFNTKVCSMCTFQRLQIIACSKHDMQRIDKWNPVTLDTAIEDLQSGRNTQIWCSVCCNIAKWQCCAEQKENPLGSTGCGLILCQLCTVVLSAFDGNLEKMLVQVKDEPSKARPFGLRADHGLLKMQGLLMRYIMGDTSTS